MQKLTVEQKAEKFINLVESIEDDFIAVETIQLKELALDFQYLINVVQNQRLMINKQLAESAKMALNIPKKIDIYG